MFIDGIETNVPTLHEPYELRMIEDLFVKIGPHAKVDSDQDILIFWCENAYYNKAIGFLFERLCRPDAKIALRILAKYRFFHILLKDRKISQCPECGDIIFDQKPWVNICPKCVVGKEE